MYRFADVEPDYSCLMTTSVTGIFYILLQCVVMNPKHPLSCSLILALGTGKHVFFITAGDQLIEQSQLNIILGNCQAQPKL